MMIIEPVGYVSSCFQEKFGTPRQPGLVPSAHGIIKLSLGPEALEGLEEFEYIWLIFEFHQNAKNQSLKVRPPRLGGNEKRGVFATRSSFRPNNIGLSLVKLEAVSENTIFISGHDLVDGTPIFDIKPYVYSDQRILSKKNWTSESIPKKTVLFQVELERSFKDLCEQTLQYDPKPAYHESDGTRLYKNKLAGMDVHWISMSDHIKVIDVVAL